MKENPTVTFPDVTLTLDFGRFATTRDPPSHFLNPTISPASDFSMRQLGSESNPQALYDREKNYGECRCKCMLPF